MTKPGVFGPSDMYSRILTADDSQTKFKHAFYKDSDNNYTSAVIDDTNNVYEYKHFRYERQQKNVPVPGSIPGSQVPSYVTIRSLIDYENERGKLNTHLDPIETFIKQELSQELVKN